MLDFIELFILGIGVGSFGALVGIGGGLIMVPLFMYFMMPPSGSTFANVQEVEPLRRAPQCALGHLGLLQAEAHHP